MIVKSPFEFILHFTKTLASIAWLVWWPRPTSWTYQHNEENPHCRVGHFPKCKVLSSSLLVAVMVPYYNGSSPMVNNLSRWYCLWHAGDTGHPPCCCEQRVQQYNLPDCIVWYNTTVCQKNILAITSPLVCPMNYNCTDSTLNDAGTLSWHLNI